MKKVVFVGDAGVGKTRLISAVCGEPLKNPDEYSPTVMDDRRAVFETRDSNGGHIEVKVTLSDTSGDEGYDRLRPLSYLDADLIVLCFSLDNPSSLRNATDRWKAELKHLLPAVPIILVGTRSDLKDAAIRHQEEQELQKQRRLETESESGFDSSGEVNQQHQKISSKYGKITSTPSVLEEENRLDVGEIKEGEEEDDEVDFSKNRYVESDRGRLLCWHLGAECYVECSSLSGAGVQSVREAIFDALLQRDSGSRRRWRRAAKLVRM